MKESRPHRRRRPSQMREQMIAHGRTDLKYGYLARPGPGSHGRIVIIVKIESGVWSCLFKIMASCRRGLAASVSVCLLSYRSDDPSIGPTRRLAIQFSMARVEHHAGQRFSVSEVVNKCQQKYRVLCRCFIATDRGFQCQRCKFESGKNSVAFTRDGGGHQRKFDSSSLVQSHKNVATRTKAFKSDMVRLTGLSNVSVRVAASRHMRSFTNGCIDYRFNIVYANRDHRFRKGVICGPSYPVPMFAI
jgi:hypothetical protein